MRSWCSKLIVAICLLSQRSGDARFDQRFVFCANQSFPILTSTDVSIRYVSILVQVSVYRSHSSSILVFSTRSTTCHGSFDPDTQQQVVLLDLNLVALVFFHGSWGIRYTSTSTAAGALKPQRVMANHARQFTRTGAKCPSLAYDGNSPMMVVIPLDLAPTLSWTRSSSLVGFPRKWHTRCIPPTGSVSRAQVVYSHSSTRSQRDIGTISRKCTLIVVDC